MQAFAFDASSEDEDGVDGDRDGFLSEGDGDASEHAAALQMECTVHEVLLKNQVRRSTIRPANMGLLLDEGGCSLFPVGIE